MSSMKKNVLAVALVAGLGLAGGAAAYNYGTLKQINGVSAPDDTGTNTANSIAVQADLDTAEVVSYEMLVAANYNWTMTEDLVFDIQLPDNAVQVTTGFTVRVKLNRNNCVDNPNVQYPSGANICSDTTDGALFSTTAPNPADLILDPSLVGFWTVVFDGYYDGGRTASFRLSPLLLNPPNPGPGILLRWRNARLTSLNEFAQAAYNGGTGKVDAEFWMVNATNDSRFAGSTKNQRILQSTRAVNACATPNGSEVDKYIDVADDFNEVQMPKTRFSWDGRLGSAVDSSGGSVQSPDDYNSQVIDLGDVTLGDNSVASFQFWGAGNLQNGVADVFKTVIDAQGSNDWNAFDNIGNNDDVYLVDGTCASGTIVDQGTISGTTVTFIYNADQAGMINGPNATGTGTQNLTVCGFVDEDIVIDDHNNHVTTTFYRSGMYPASGSAPGDATDSYPTNGIANGVGSKTYTDPDAGGNHCDLLPLRYNGSTMEIFTINPGSNTTQRSFIRLTNRSATDGYVSLEGIDNAGVHGASQVRVWVEAGKSVQLDAADLENGTNGAVGAWGAPTDGKWRAIVTAEFPGLVASSLVNSALPRVLTNITDSDTRGEQINRDFAEGTWGNEAGQRPSDFVQEYEPDFRGDGNWTGEPGGPDANDGPAGGTTDECGNPGMDGSLPTNCVYPQP